MRPIGLFRDIYEEAMVPSTREESPYTGFVIALSHALLGAVLISIFPVWIVVVVRPLLGIGYWAVKERADLRNRGMLKDGILDSLMVYLGTFYGPAWWPIAVFVASYVSVIINNMGNSE